MNILLARDFQSLSLFRVVFAVYLLAHFYLLELPSFVDFYGDASVLPPATLAADRVRGLWLTSPVWRALDAIRVRAWLPVLYPAALFAFAIGYRTRLANFIVYVLNTFVFMQDFFILSGAELLAHLLLLWCLFLPLDRYWAVDGALDPRPRDRPYPLLPFLALRLQITSVYVFAALFKLTMSSWLDGSAVSWSLQDNVFGGRATGLYLVDHSPMLLSVLTELVIVLQLAFPFLIYCPWRNDLTRGFALAATAGMHSSFIFCLAIGPFPYISLTMLLLLVPDRWVAQLLRARRARLARVAVFYEPGCVLCQKISLLLREFLLSPTAAVLPASADAEALRLLSENRSWVVRRADGAMLLKWQALAYLLRQNPFFAPLGWLSDRLTLQPWFDRLYDFIGKHRRGLGKITKVVLPFHSPAPVGKPAQALCGLLAAVSLAVNVISIEPPAFGAARDDRSIRFAHRAPSWLVELAVDLQVWQGWALFVPPPHWRRDYRLIGYNADGTGLDLMARLPVPPVLGAPDGRLIFADTRWQKLFSQFDLLTGRDWASFGRYLCHSAQHGNLPPTFAIRVIQLSATTTPVEGTPLAGMPSEQHRRFECWEDR
jgi:hypothetical protein